MTDHHQTATERFIETAVYDGGFGDYDNVVFSGETVTLERDYDQEDGYQVSTHTTVESLLLNPALWEAAGRSLGWSQGGIGVCGNCGGRTAKNCQCPDDVWYVLEEPQYQMRGLVDWLWAHPGDVDGYLAALLKRDE